MKKKPRAYPGKWLFRLMLLLSLLLAGWLILQFLVLPQSDGQALTAPEGAGDIRALYRQEIGAQYLQPILLPAGIYLVLTTICIGYYLVRLRRERKQLVSARHAGPFRTAPDGRAASTERRKRFVAVCVCGVFCTVCVVMCVLRMVKLIGSSAWSTASAAGMILLRLLPWVTAILAAVMVLFAWLHRSHLRELEACESADGERPANRLASSEASNE